MPNYDFMRAYTGGAITDAEVRAEERRKRRERRRARVQAFLSRLPGWRPRMSRYQMFALAAFTVTAVGGLLGGSVMACLVAVGAIVGVGVLTAISNSLTDRAVEEAASAPSFVLPWAAFEGPREPPLLLDVKRGPREDERLREKMAAWMTRFRTVETFPIDSLLPGNEDAARAQSIMRDILAGVDPLWPFLLRYPAVWQALCEYYPDRRGDLTKMDLPQRLFETPTMQRRKGDLDAQGAAFVVAEAIIANHDLWRFFEALCDEPFWEQAGWGLSNYPFRPAD